VRALPSRLEHLLFQRWVPDSSPAYVECGQEHGDSDPYQAEWGVARITLIALEEGEPHTPAAAPAQAWRSATATLEVVRVLSLEGDPASPGGDGDWAGMEQLVVRPSIDTVTLSWDRRDDGWRRCGSVFLDRPPEPIDIVGPEAETLLQTTTAPKPVPAGASWARARTLADSIGRAGPAVVIRLSPHAPRHPAASLPDSAP
jgi:hypothetical protein